MSSLAISVWRSYREYLGENIGEGRQDKEPDSDHRQYPPSPFLHPWGLRFDLLNGLILSSCDTNGSSKHASDQDDGCDHERYEGCPKAAHGQRVAGQTGQDRPSSPKPGKHIRKAENGESQNGAVSPQPGLLLQERLNHAAHRMHRHRQYADLDQPQQDQ